ncbi:MAG: penicillin-binding protein 2 [Patescibacteria group bacterium]|jgi:cell division protein FtsI/penicillin-binding protein 2
MPGTRRNSRVVFSRPDALKLFFALPLILVVFRLFVIQVLDHEDYKVMAAEQHWIVQEIPPKRGDILSRDGFVLAGIKTNYILFAEPNKVERKDLMAKDMARILANYEPEDKRAEQYDFYFNKITGLLNSGLQWVIVEKSIDQSQKEALEEAGIEGIGFEEDPLRYYPEKTLCSHVLGFLASNEGGDKQGYYGIEGKLNGDLKGKSGRVVQEKDARGDPILIGGFEKVPPINGRKAVLTIDRSVQYLVERKLKEGVEKYKAVSGSVIVMDPMTSEVIAMANYPTYSPDNFGYVQEEEVDGSETEKMERKNFSISETYEPGSVLKPLTVAAALDMGRLTLESTFNDEGPVQYSDYVIDNWDGKHHGVQNIIQLLQKSNNIGAAWVGHQVGAKKLSEYLVKFGLGSNTGIDLEGEDTGVIRDPKIWTDIDLATISFGQGISATPLQVLNAFNVFANGGELYQPKIVHMIIDNGEEIDIPKRKIGRVISEDTADTMMSALVEAVSGGESKYYNITTYKIAGKTGTAQVPSPDGKYDQNKTNATFLGIMATTKKFSMIVKLNEPTTSTFASETAVPLWMDMAKDLINYYGIAPDTVQSD